LAFSSLTYAQSSVEKIENRQEAQQGRIQEGVKSGELTPLETSTLERKQAAIETKKLNSTSDGIVTPKEKAKITKKQNKAGRAIARKITNSRNKDP
jgi:hypothetical protein